MKAFVLILLSLFLLTGCAKNSNQDRRYFVTFESPDILVQFTVKYWNEHPDVGDKVTFVSDSLWVNIESYPDGTITSNGEHKLSTRTPAQIRVGGAKKIQATVVRVIER